MIEGFEERKQVLLDELANNAGIDPLTDRYKTGYIAAINDMQNIEVQEVELNGN